ncbi:hypothetical protein WNE31_18400, partial [Shimia sp. SDUM112013]
GDDVVVAGFQLDTLHGGDGTDQLTLDYSGVSAGGLTATGLYLRLDTDGGYSSQREHIYLSDDSTTQTYFQGFEVFAITGSSGDDRITTREGDDHLIGGAGHDDLSAGAGDDRLSGGAGNDTLRGG